SHDNERVTTAAGPCSRHTHRPIELDRVPYRARGIVRMRLLIDGSAFDHQDERSVRGSKWGGYPAGKKFNRFSRHPVEHRLIGKTAKVRKRLGCGPRQEKLIVCDATSMLESVAARRAELDA